MMKHKIAEYLIIFITLVALALAAVLVPEYYAGCQARAAHESVSIITNGYADTF